MIKTDYEMGVVELGFYRLGARLAINGKAESINEWCISLRASGKLSNSGFALRHFYTKAHPD